MNKLGLKIFLFFIILWLNLSSITAKYRYESLYPNDSIQLITQIAYKEKPKLDWRITIAPIALIGIGVNGFFNHGMIQLDHDISRKFKGKSSRRVSDYLQYVPMVAVYGLNLCQVKGKHRFIDRTILLAISYATMASVVTTLKYTTGVRRPDGSSFNSFPSGHTATAFMGAEFMRMEYKDVSPWIGVAGYLVATTTGFLQIGRAHV